MQGYIHQVSVILHDNLQRVFHKLYVPPTSVTWLQLLSRQKNSGTSTALAAETHWFTRTRLRALLRLWHRPMLANLTCVWRWRLCGINPVIPDNFSQHISCLNNCFSWFSLGNWDWFCVVSWLGDDCFLPNTLRSIAFTGKTSVRCLL
jgi:hypothetical protein